MRTSLEKGSHVTSPGAVIPAVFGRFGTKAGNDRKRPETAGVTAPGEATWDPFSRPVCGALIYYGFSVVCTRSTNQWSLNEHDNELCWLL